MADRLKGKVVLIFGAGCVSDTEWGNGNATAVTFAREGAAIISVDIVPDAAGRTADLVRKEGREALELTADVTNDDQVRAAVARTMERFGRIDVLHNNVGANTQGGPVETTEAAWDKVVDGNVKSVFLTCRAVLPIMEKQGSGSIINISSVASIAWTGHPLVAYHASKAAVNQFTKSVAVQYAAKGIRCNVILPGLIDTPRIHTHVLPAFGGDVEKMRAARSSAVPAKRMGTPWDIANAALFLASDESSYINGLVMPVDGGLTCCVPSS